MKKNITSFIYKKISHARFLYSNYISLKESFLKIKSYADFSEDLIIESLASSKSISYVDIGAGHPIIGSNTYYFYRKKCKGTVIEPIKFHSNIHKIIRRKDQVINALAGNSDELKTFYEFSPTQYSTNSIDQYNKMVSRGMRARKIYEVRTIDINRILIEKNNIPFFISIDCEGYDLEILKIINFKKLNNLFCIVIEKPDNSEARKQIDVLLRRSNFVLQVQTNNNLIYLKNYITCGESFKSS
jgi:FkbM family methyltransferase